MTEIQQLDEQISDLIDHVDNGTLNDIFLDAIVNQYSEHKLSDKQILNILRFVLKELTTASKEETNNIVSSDYKNIEV